MYILIEYSDSYSKTSGSLQQYQRDEPAVDHNDAIADFSGDNYKSLSYKSKGKLAANEEMMAQKMLN